MKLAWQVACEISTIFLQQVTKDANVSNFHCVRELCLQPAVSPKCEVSFPHQLLWPTCESSNLETGTGNGRMCHGISWMSACGKDRGD